MSTDCLRFQWERAFREAQIRPASVMLVGFIYASYASADGTSIHPGVARVMTGAGLKKDTVENALKTLRRLGWLRLASEKRGNRRSGLADEYVLSFPDQAEVPRPDPSGGPTDQAEDSRPDGERSSRTSSVDQAEVLPSIKPKKIGPTNTSTNTSHTAAAVTYSGTEQQQESKHKGDVEARSAWAEARANAGYKQQIYDQNGWAS